MNVDALIQAKLEEDSSCELCNLEPVTKWHSNNSRHVVLDCKTCNTPMVVWRHHTMKPPKESVFAGYEALARVADKKYGVGGWLLDKKQRSNASHAHWHARSRERF